MAWNEPGGSGKKDPWGGGNGDQGPPDLDEVVKKMQDKFGAIFGGGKGKGGSGSGGSSGSLGLGLIVIIAAVVYALSGFYIIDQGKVGVVLAFGKYDKTTLPGLHWYPRFIQTVEVVDVEQIRGASIGYRSTGTGRNSTTRVERESLMLTQDENIVDIQLAVQFKVKDASAYLFNVKDPDTTLRQATESAIREVIGKNKMDFVLTQGRSEIANRVHDLTQEILDRYKTGLLITSVNMQDAQPPEQVQAAFDDAVKAREDNQRLKNEAEAYSNDIIPRAQGKAARLLQEADAYRQSIIDEAKGKASRFDQVYAAYKKAPEVTRKRLYLEAVESMLTKSSKVMVDVKGSNNLLYLPIDRLMGQKKPVTMSNEVSPNTSSTMQSSDNKHSRDLRDNLRSRERR